MVKIASKDFNKNIGNYIDKRKRGSSSKLNLKLNLPFGKKKNYDEEVPDLGPSEVHVEYKQPGRLSKKISGLFSFRKKMIQEAVESEDLSPEEMAKLRAMEDDIEEAEQEIDEKEGEVREIREEEAEIVADRESMLKRLFQKLNVFKRISMETVDLPDEYQQGEAPALDQDVINVLKIVHKWIEQLTPPKKRSFKASKDFQKYKTVLDKYGLIKKK